MLLHGGQPDQRVVTGQKHTPPFLDAPQPDLSLAQVHLLPCPMEATVSYGGGTSHGPRAILEASTQLELYDRQFDCEPALLYGVHTFEEMVLSTEPATAIEEIASRVAEVYQPGKLLGVLGGEHSLTYGVLKGLVSRRPRPIVVVQLDAHSDLRDEYEGSPFSHASVARRMLELPEVEQILQLGIRSLCPEEAQVIREDSRVRTWFTEDVHGGRFEDELRERVRGKDIYLTVDVDGFDPTLIPSTGTPEPWGLSYIQGEQIFQILSEEANLVAFDCVELAPVAGSHASDFIVAKLVYRLMNLFLRDKIQKLKEEQS